MNLENQQDTSMRKFQTNSEKLASKMVTSDYQGRGLFTQKNLVEKISHQSQSQLKNQNQNRKQEINVSKKKQTFSFVNQKIPCSFCDKPLTLQQTDRHHRECSMAFNCRYCFDFFPNVFMYQHNKVCKGNDHTIKQDKKNNRQYYNSYKHQNQKSNLATEQQLRLIRQYKEIPRKLLIQHLRAQEQKKKQEQLRFSYMYKSREEQPWYHYAFQNQRLRNYNYIQNHQFDRNRNIPDILYRNRQNNSHFQADKKQKIAGLKDYQIKNLVTDRFRKGKNKQQEICTICTLQKQEGETIVRLSCFHTFHQQCIVPWVKVKPVCPTCKFNIKYK